MWTKRDLFVKNVTTLFSFFMPELSHGLLPTSLVVPSSTFQPFILQVRDCIFSIKKIFFSHVWLTTKH